MTAPPQQLALVFASGKAGREVARHVVRVFFGFRELPQALGRMLLTREFRWFVGFPVLLLLAAQLTTRLAYGQSAAAVSLGLNGLAVVWLIAGLVRIGRYGPSTGIACYAINADGQPGALVGALRMRLERGRRRLWIAGLVVDPAWRGRRIGTALMLGALRLAQEEAKRAPLVVSVFAPSHPASKAIVAKYLHGMQTLQVSAPPPANLCQMIDELEAAVDRSGIEYRWQLDKPPRGLFKGDRGGA